MLDAYCNEILHQLESESRLRLRLSKVEFAIDQTVQRQGDYLHRIHFLETGLASSALIFADGREIECNLIGKEGLLGSPALLGEETSHMEVTMLVAGSGYSSRVTDARAEFARGGQFHELILRAFGYQQQLIAHRIGSVAHHTVTERVAGWLLSCTDLTHLKKLPLTQAKVARAVGTQRATVSTVLGNLEGQRILLNRREEIEILDEKALKTIGECCIVSRAA